MLLMVRTSRTHRLRAVLALLPGITLTTLCHPTAEAQGTVPAYRFIDLGTLRGMGTQVTGINNAGQISGYGWYEYASTSTGPFTSNSRAFRITPLSANDGSKNWAPLDVNGVNPLMAVFSLPGTFKWSEARGINASGAVAGQMLGDGYTTPQNSFYGDPNLTGVRVTTEHSWAWAINDAGNMVGEYWPNKGGEYAALWSLVNGSFTKTTIGNGQARGVNNSNQVAGHDGNGGGNAWIWLPSPAYGLPAGKNYIPALNSSVAINDSGYIVGSDGNGHAVLWTPAYGASGPATTLTGPGLTNGYARAINNPATGQPVVIGGSAQNALGQSTAFVWSSADEQPTAKDLQLITETPPMEGMFEIRGVNSEGLMVGNYRVTEADGRIFDRPFLLVPDRTLPNAADAPAGPSGLSVSAPAEKTLALSWTDNATNENGYKIDVSTDQTGWGQVASLPSNAFEFSGIYGQLKPAVLYYVRVTPFNVKGYGPSAQGSVTTPGAPLAPSSCRATALSSSSIRVTWTSNSTAQTGFVLEYSTSSTFSPSTTVSLPSSAAQYDVTGLRANTTYYFHVKALRAGIGDSPYSNTASRLTPRK